MADYPGYESQKLHVTLHAQGENLPVLEAIIENLTVGVAIANNERKLLVMNSEALRQHGFRNIEDARKQLDHFRDIFELRSIEGEPLPMDAMPLARALDGERFADYEVTVRRRDTGESWYISYSGTPIYNGAGVLALAVVTSHDVTGGKKLEQTLREQADQFRHVVESAPNGIVVVDSDGHISLVNAQVEHAFGYDRDDLIGQPVEKLLPKRFRGRHPGLRGGFMAQPKARAMGAGRDLFALRKDGTEFPVEIGLTPLKIQGSTMVLASVVDITERKQDEQRLRESEERFRQIAENIREVFYSADVPNAQMLYISPAFEDLYGRSVQSMYDAPTSYLEMVHPDDRELILGVIERQKAGEQTETEFRIVRPDGSTRWVFDRAFPLKDGEGRVYRIIGTTTDVTERKRAEEMVRFLAQASFVLAGSLDYQTTLDSVAKLVVPEFANWFAIDLVDQHGGLQQVTIAHEDPSKVEWARELRRRYPPDMNAQTGSPNVLRTGKSELYPFIPEELLRGAAVDEEHYHLIKDVGMRSAIVAPLAARGRTLGVMTFVLTDPGRNYSEADLPALEELARTCALAVDNARLYGEAQREIEDRRRAEEEIKHLNETLEVRVADRTLELERANRELQMRNRELQEFAYVASHDLQEPLRKIHSFADILADEYSGSLDEEGNSYLDRIRHAALRLSSLISALLGFSRVQTRSEPFETVNLNRIVREVLTDLEEAVRASGARVMVEDLPEIEADQTQMRQLMQNLIGNAIKYRHEDMPPEVRIRAYFPASASDVIIEVEDNGIGFDEKYLDRVFTPFQRLHGTGQYGGTGMGLAICRRIAERHGGSITARSTPGEGTTFIVTLPVEQAPHVAPE